MLRTRMQWQQERQRVLSDNVANADTPNYRPRDLAPLDFTKPRPATEGSVPLVRTNPLHLAGPAPASSFAADRKPAYEVRPAGNAVNLEDQMLKVAANQMDYQAVTTLYSRSLGLIKTALGRSA
jgi:flagellar basal-body rod protein FlgB